MEASKRERILLLGVVPVIAAISGAIFTVVAQKWFGGDNTAAIAAVVQASGLSPAEKIKALDAINKNDQQFYDFLRGLFIMLGAPIMVLAMSIGARIRG